MGWGEWQPYLLYIIYSCRLTRPTGIGITTGGLVHDVLAETRPKLAPRLAPLKIGITTGGLVHDVLAPDSEETRPTGPLNFERENATFDVGAAVLGPVLTYVREGESRNGEKYVILTSVLQFWDLCLPTFARENHEIVKNT